MTISSNASEHREDSRPLLAVPPGVERCPRWDGSLTGGVDFSARFPDLLPWSAGVAGESGRATGMTTTRAQTRRSAYRVDLSEDFCVIGVRIATEAGATVPGWVFDLSAKGVGLRVPTASVSQLDVGSVVALEFTGERLPEPLRVRAVVREQLPQIPLHRFGFEFLDRSEFERSLASTVLRTLFNRRGAVRVPAGRGAPIPVTLSDPASGTRRHGELIDLSMTGMGVLLPHRREHYFREVDRMVIVVTLPPEDLTLLLEGVVSSRTHDRRGIRYGLVFDPERSKDYEQREAVILNYLRSAMRSGAASPPESALAAGPAR